MTDREAIEYIENLGWSTSRPGLERITQLLQNMGNPQNRVRYVHVTGSNGKGSTCAMVASVLQQAGYKTGLYTSPYIQVFHERIQINGQHIPPHELALSTQRVKDAAEQMGDHPSQFELVTAVAFDYFARMQCDIVVLEVGLGGLLDATNVIPAPEVAVLTNIGLEHTEYLGSTIAEIAANKAGIIKPGCHVVAYPVEYEAAQAIRQACQKANVPLLLGADFSQLQSLSADLQGQRFAYKGRHYSLNLIGEYQLFNAAMAIETVEALRLRGWQISEQALENGLAQAQWPARMEAMAQSPLFLLDGGHNPQCADALASALKKLLPGQKQVFLLGLLADKDYRTVIHTLLPFAREFVCLTPVSPRALPASELAEVINQMGGKAQSCGEEIDLGIATTLQQAQQEGSGVVCFGSLYLAGIVRTRFLPVYKAFVRKQGKAARNALSQQIRQQASRAIAEKLRQLPAYQSAERILLYHGVGAEVNLEAFASQAKADGKQLAYPLCLPQNQMKALCPNGPDAWEPGPFQIPQPIEAKSQPFAPNTLDLVICPCTAFDEQGGRMGMGGGYYDRYLPLCTNAFVAAVAFEAQKAVCVPQEETDRPVQAVVTEAAIYQN